jgi:hypothetical protein
MELKPLKHQRLPSEELIFRVFVYSFAFKVDLENRSLGGEGGVARLHNF